MSAAELWSSRRALALALLGCLMVLSLSLLRARWELRFVHPALDGLVVAAAAFGAPLLLGRLGDRLGRRSERWAAWTAAAILTVPLLPYGALALVHGLDSLQPDGQDRVLLGEVRVQSGTYRLYTVYCLHTCPNALQLRKEQDLLLVKAVSTVWQASAEARAELHPGEDGSVEVTRHGDVLYRHRE